MGLGIREPTGVGHVPGTVKLFESDVVVPVGAIEEIGRVSLGLQNKKKCDNNGVILVPQPSDSPNDPLNWPLWKKDLTLFVISLATSVGTTVGPVLGPINGELVTEFHTTYTTVANFAGYQFAASGAAGLLCEVIARLWGKRPIYFLSVAFLFAGTVWNAMVPSGDVGGFMGARVLQGIGLGTFETLAVSSIGDMYFIHQRGRRIAFYNLLFLGTSYFTPVISGYVAVKYGWRFQFKLIAGFLFLALIMVFFFCPEHTFVRERKFETDLASGGSSITDVSSTENKEKVPETASVEPKRTFVQELKLYNGRFSSEGFWKLLLAPFPCMLYPATIWACLIQGTFVTWGVGISVVLAEIFGAPPYNFSPQKMGYIYTAPTIGALLSYMTSYFTSDSLCLFLGRRNNLTYEPEFRILHIIPVFLAGIPGLIAYGYSTTTPGLSWIIPSILYALFTFAVILSATATYSYLLDANREISVEMMVAVLLFKNFFAFGCTFYLPNWIASWGPRKVFLTLGCIQTCLCLSSILVYIYGKVWRAKMQRFGLLDRLGLRPEKMKS